MTSDEFDFDLIQAAVDSAVGELGDTANFDALDARIDEILGE